MRSLEVRLGIPYFLHPVPLSAVALLILNDHFLKTHYPSWFTGKLSDFAGLFFTPLFICAVVNLFRNIVRKAKPLAWLSSLQLISAIILIDGIFVAIKLSVSAAVVYSSWLGALGFPSHVTHDSTDLIALTVSALTYLFGRRFF